MCFVGWGWCILLTRAANLVFDLASAISLLVHLYYNLSTELSAFNCAHPVENHSYFASRRICLPSDLAVFDHADGAFFLSRTIYLQRCPSLGECEVIFALQSPSCKHHPSPPCGCNTESPHDWNSANFAWRYKKSNHDRSL